MAGIFDSHAHYDDAAFDDDRDELLNGLPGQGVDLVLNCACDLNSCRTTLELSEKYDYIYAACGVHGLDAESVKGVDFIPALRDFCKAEKCVAIGEIGLDYHYEAETRELQLEVFEKQLALAKELDLPVIVHDREAHADVLELLRKYRPTGVLHCFTGSVEMAKEIISLGMYIGLGGAVTFKNARKPVEVASFVPEDRLLTETDCPYMTPVPHRGKRNDSSFIRFTAERLAEIRETDTQHIIDIANANAARLFKIG